MRGIRASSGKAACKTHAEHGDTVGNKDVENHGTHQGIPNSAVPMNWKPLARKKKYIRQYMSQ